MSTHHKSKHTFRPYLTQEEILHIISLTQADISNPLSEAVYKKCKALTFKIAEQIVTPAYERKRESLEEKLGFSISSTTKQGLKNLAEEAYKIWLDAEKRTTLSLSELEMVQEYRYTNDLMSQEEEQEYEANLL